MKVYAVRLREKGVKLPTPSVQLAVPTLGYLWLSNGRTPDTNKPCLFAYLTESADLTSKHVFPTLKPAMVKRVRYSQLIIVGVERIGDKRWHQEWKQAWWCRIPEQL